MFKVGDRVRFLGLGGLIPKYSEGVIMSLGSDDAEVKFKGIEHSNVNKDRETWGVFQYELEHIESAKTATAMTVKPILHTNYTLVIKDQKINLTKSELYDLMEVVKGELNE